jgi:diguanylate cyclase (GGDEF)-like protein/PAS domain S-box-containing protein
VANIDNIDFRFLAENSADLICSVDLDRVLRYVSPSSLKLLGWRPEEMIDRQVEDFMLHEDHPVMDTIASVVRSGDGEHPPVSVRMKRNDGFVLWMEVSVRLGKDADTGAPTQAVIVMRDITERKGLEDKLSALALTDGLTGLANRRAFDEALDREWKRTLREGSQISLLLLDLDHFKLLNDRCGHQVGDDCLRAVAAAVSAAVRETDIVARYGGEEIAIILPSAASAGALETAEKVRAAIEDLQLTHQDNPEGGGWVTASIGVATALARQGGTIRMPESLLLAADNALYKAKHEGRNRLATTLLVAPKEPLL